MTKLKTWTPQEDEIRRLRKRLNDTSKMIAELSDENGLSLENCIKVMQLINDTLKGD